MFKNLFGCIDWAISSIDRNLGGLMFKNLSLKMKFTIIMLIVGFVANLTVAAGAFYYIQKFKKHELMHEAKMVLFAEKAARDYDSNSLRPAVMKATDKFVIQAESATFLSLGVAKLIKKFLPHYTYSEPTLNPLNLKNKANSFQEKIIDRFKSSPFLKSVSGYHRFNGLSYFYVMKPVVAKQGCMVCHGNPENNSPITKAIVKRYGDTHGWHWRVGTVVGALSVWVPTKYIDQSAMKNSIIIGIAIFVLPFLAFIIALLFIDRVIIKPIHDMSKLAEDVSVGKSNEDFKARGNDEIGALAKSFNRLKKSYLKAVQLLAERHKEEK
ncbi:MAG: DUF3365 domain-containing protein [Deltaproteobacteria bacterium]|nr:DUF3365 domain-containing protein [Deltaproteobacteria bacterium]MCL5880773.1 DUF3365 domain-containing protein [Deltaproteobacteria bacterium]MDA8304239.1 DUF3365 domain-containing protein [Deltaproteobacteria bacterium]